jgi:hypothetical protein
MFIIYCQLIKMFRTFVGMFIICILTFNIQCPISYHHQSERFNAAATFFNTVQKYILKTFFDYESQD